MSIPYTPVPAGAAEIEDAINKAFQAFAALGQANVEATTNTPPATVLLDAGKMWLVGTTPAAGAWSGRANNLALCTAANVWAFYAPGTSAWLIWDKGATQMKRWDGSAWIVFTSTSGSTSKGHIDGLKMLWVGTNAITVTNGEAYIEGSSGVLAFSSSVAVTGISLGNNVWGHVYAYSNAGTPAIEIVTAAPAAPYSGTARSKTGDTSRRYIGSVRTNGSGQIYKFTMVGTRITYLLDVTASPFRVLSNGTATAWTSFSYSAVVPVTSTQVYTIVQNIDTVVSFNVSSGASGADFTYVINPKQVVPIDLPLSSTQTFNYQATGVTATGLYADALAYTYER